MNQFCENGRKLLPSYDKYRQTASFFSGSAPGVFVYQTGQDRQV